LGIAVSNITKSFGDPPVHVLHDMSFNISDGEFVSLTGKSGSGKSTLLYIISSLDFASSGEVEISGVKISTLNSKELHEFRNLHMGFVFQFHYLLTELTAIENVLMPARKTNSLRNRKSFGEHLLEKFGLGDKLDRLPGQLSGGEQQRVAIARALVMEPKYLFADEPTGNLDSANGKIVMDIFKEINEAKGSTVVFVTHDKDFAATAERIIELVDGKIV